MEFWDKLFGSKAEEEEEPPPSVVIPETFPYELESFAGRMAILELEKARRRGIDEGFTPVILGGAEDIAGIWDNAEMNETSPQDILEKSKNLDVSNWFEERQSSDPEYYRVETGPWLPDVPQDETLHAIRDSLTNKLKNPVYIAKIPTVRSWEIPAYLRLGGWDECPSPECQAAASKYWNELYGADIVAVTADTVEYFVENPPQDRAAAEKLAREQFVYCADLVHQGLGNLNNLASSLLKNPTWYFCWD